MKRLIELAFFLVAIQLEAAIVFFAGSRASPPPRGNRKLGRRLNQSQYDLKDVDHYSSR